MPHTMKFQPEEMNEAFIRLCILALKKIIQQILSFLLMMLIIRILSWAVTIPDGEDQETRLSEA